jgi:hypothetical protein
MGAAGSKKKVEIDAHLKRDVTKEDIKQAKVPYIKNYNLRLDSDYDDEMDSFADETRLDMIIAARERQKEEEAVVEPEDENQLLLDDDEQPGGMMGIDDEGASLAKQKADIRPVRAEMDPQSKNALEADL